MDSVKHKDGEGSWEAVIDHLTALSRHVDDSGLNEIFLKRDIEMGMLLHAAMITNRLMYKDNPHDALPFRGWRTHLAAKTLKLGPAPRRAFRHPEGHHDTVEMMYQNETLS